MQDVRPESFDAQADRLARYAAAGRVRLAETRGDWRNNSSVATRGRRLLRRIMMGREAPTPTQRFQQLIDSGQVTIGHYSYGLPIVHVFPGESTRIHIGAYCAIATEAEIFVGGNHHTDWVTTFPFEWFFSMEGVNPEGHLAPRGDVHIGNDVWIGTGATVLSGVTIGDGAVIGARAVVGRDVRPYAVVVGSPAREVRRRFPDDQVEALLRIRWWDWPIERVIPAVEELCSEDLHGFIQRHDPASRPELDDASTAPTAEHTYADEPRRRTATSAIHEQP